MEKEKERSEVELERKIKKVEWKAMRERRMQEGKREALKRLREEVEVKRGDIEEREREMTIRKVEVKKIERGGW